MKLFSAAKTSCSQTEQIFTQGIPRASSAMESFRTPGSAATLPQQSYVLYMQTHGKGKL